MVSQLAYALIAILISSIGVTIPVFADSHNIPPLSVRTDSNSYDQGDTVVITGLVKHPEEGIPVTLRILDSNSKLVGIDQFNPAADGSFSRTYIATGPLWKASGNYTIIAQYGSAQQAETTFVFSGGSGTTEINPAEKKVFKVNLGDQGTFDVEYIIKGGMVQRLHIMGRKLLAAPEP